jgi:glycosyltransferase involved in cell wall biosynthesis
MTGARGVPLQSTDAVLVAEVELSNPIEAIRSQRSGSPHRRAVVLARLHGHPLGLVELDLPDGQLAAEQVANAIWAQTQSAVAAHLATDGVDGPTTLGVDGIALEFEPTCVRERRSFLVDPPRLTVIIPTRDRPQRVRDCLDRILANSYPHDRYEILVIDNAPSSDETARVVREYGRTFPVRYGREDRSGSASARNRGMVLAEDELVVFTDDDAIVDRDWLAEIARAFVRHPEASAITGTLLPRELETPAQLWFEQYGGFSRGFEPRTFNLTDHRDDGPLYPYSAGIFGTGNNMSFRLSALRDVGGFDPALGNGTPALGGVDSEALLRVVLSGLTLVYEPSAIVWHIHRPDYEGLRKQVHDYGVGLTAYLLKIMLHRPDLLPDLARRIPRGIRFALSPSSTKNHGKRADYPRELTRIELRGMLYGPLAYARSRRRYGQHDVPAWNRRRARR